jgi:membrane protein required for colicin V production
MVFDIIFLLIFCWAAYKGFTRGFILQSASLAALILGIYGAIRFSDLVAGFLIRRYDMSGDYMPIIAFAFTFLGIVVTIHILARLAEKLLKAIALNLVNRLLGIVFNLLKYALLISGFLVILNGINRKVHILPQDKIRESILYRPLSVIAPTLFPYLRFDFSLPGRPKPDDAQQNMA